MGKKKLYLSDLKLLWKKSFQGRQISNLSHMGAFCIDSKHNLIFNDFSDWPQHPMMGRVLLINHNGEAKQLFIVNRPINPPVIGKEGNIYFTTAAEHSEDFDGHQLICIDQNGNPILSRGLIGYPSALPFFDSEGNIIVFSTKPKTIVMNVLKPDGQQKTINIEAEVETPAILSSPAVSHNGNTLLQLSDGNMVFLSQGQTKWNIKLDALASSNVVFDRHENCYIASGDKLFCFNNQGQINWENESSIGYRGISLAPTGDIFVTLHNGDVMCIDKTGGVKWVNNSTGYLSRIPIIIDFEQNVCVISEEEQAFIIKSFNCQGKEIQSRTIQTDITETIIGYALSDFRFYLLSVGTVEKKESYDVKLTLYSMGNV